MGSGLDGLLKPLAGDQVYVAPPLAVSWVASPPQISTSSLTTATS